MSRNVVSCMQPAGQGNDFYSDGTDGKPTFRRCANQSWLSKICNHFADIATWSSKSLATFTQKLIFFWKKGPLRANVQKCFPKGFTTSQIQIHILCANFVKFGWPEIGKVVRYLPERKQNFHSLSRSRFCTDRAQNLPRPAPYNIIRVPQISSKSVYFRRSYSRTREHHWNAPQSVSSTPRRFFTK